MPLPDILAVVIPESIRKYHDPPFRVENPVLIRITAHIKACGPGSILESWVCFLPFQRGLRYHYKRLPQAPVLENPFCKAGLPDAEAISTKSVIRKAVLPFMAEYSFFRIDIICLIQVSHNPCILSSDSQGYCPFSRSTFAHSFKSS